MTRTIFEAAPDWIERLNLTDWKITVKHALPRDFREMHQLGSCQASHEHKSALIRVLPKEFDPHDGSSISGDWSEENVLVHELLHIHFHFAEGWVKAEPLREILLEQAINALAAALCPVEKSE